MNGFENTGFWLAAAVLAAGVAIALAFPFLRRKTDETRSSDHDVEAFRAQLEELEQDRARGILTDAEYENARIEVSRRLLAADARRAQEQAAMAAPAGQRAMFGAIGAVGVPLLAAAIYLGIGTPGMPDFPLQERRERAAAAEERPSQEQAETEMAERGLAPEQPDPNDPDVRQFAALVDRVAQRLEQEPEDARGRLLMARSTARLGRYAESWRHYARLLETADTPDPQLWSEMAESMILATNGYVSPQAESALDRALEATRDPQARYYKGLALAQRGRLREALADWRVLLDEAPPGASWAALVHERAVQAANELGEEPPKAPEGTPTQPGPSAGDIAAASEMSAADRNAMIEGMVAGLASRLDDNPDDLEGWLRLIRAYRVMGRAEDAQSATAKARATFAGNEQALARIEAAMQ